MSAVHPIDRRTFLKTGAVAASALAFPSIARGKSPNETIRLAVVGFRGRGGNLAEEFAATPGVEVVALADVDSNLFAKGIELVQKGGGKAPEVMQDFRPLLDRKDIDAIAIATPDHWHALATLWSLDAGKHVYVEKPVSHNFAEGVRMVEATKRTGLVVQVGTQRRSSAFYKEAHEFVQSGALGKIGLVRAWYNHNRGSIGKKPDGPVPDGVDYNLWLGPGPDKPFNPNRFHYEWHWFWDYGTGELGNNGIHALDMARTWLNLGLPERVSSGGGAKIFDDDRETPQTQIASWEYPGLTLTWEHRQWNNSPLEGSSFGVAFYGSEGTLRTDGAGWEVVREKKEIEKHGGDIGEMEHLANFAAAIKEGASLNAPIEEGHLSTALTQLGNIAFRLGRTLDFDPAAGRFTNDDEANKMLGREYRKPFVLPETVG